MYKPLRKLGGFFLFNQQLGQMDEPARLGLERFADSISACQTRRLLLIYSPYVTTEAQNQKRYLAFNSLKSKVLCWYRLTVRTKGFHPLNRSSILRISTNIGVQCNGSAQEILTLPEKVRSFLFLQILLDKDCVVSIIGIMCLIVTQEDRVRLSATPKQSCDIKTNWQSIQSQKLGFCGFKSHRDYKILHSSTGQNT